MNNYDDSAGQHPLFQPDGFHLMTPAVEKLHAQLWAWLSAGITGGVILGESRNGKTTAIEMIQNQLILPGSNVPTPSFLAYIPVRDAKTIRNCYAALVDSMELSYRPRDTSDHLSYLVVGRLDDLAASSPSRRVILFVDEFQRLTLQQVSVFADIQNGLRNRGKSAHIFFIGNRSESLGVLEHIDDARYAHVRGRFFINSYDFHGIRSKTELKSCLSLYDSMRYPKNGPTYTQAFLSDAWLKRWRLSRTADHLWDAYRETASTFGLKSWGMQHFTNTVKTLLTHYLPTLGIEAMSPELAKKCVEVGGLNPTDLIRVRS